jgi:predicted metalloprotease with PDZ domain
MRTRYRLSVREPHTHLVEVEARFEGAADHGGALDLHMAAWTPGSYLVRDYARHVQDVAAVDETGRALAVAKQDKARWRVTLAGGKDLVLRYRVYAWELTVRTSHVDETHAFLNGAPTYLWLAERQAEPAEVLVEVPAGWQVVCGLRPLAHDRFHAASLDELIDSPIHAGPGRVHEFTAAGKPTQLAVWGRLEAGAADVEKLVADTRTIIEHYAKLFGGDTPEVPYDRYAFQLMLAPGAYGGLEHRASTALLSSPFAFATRKKYEELLELVSHEYFHLWNVKRIRPRALGPFDYQRENYTKHLWVSEGMTSYYGDLILRRAGLISVNEYLQAWGQTMAGYLQTPGRFEQSATTASFNAWIKHYRPDENSPNTAMSYYTKGEILGLLFDLEIRTRTNNAQSLDDVMRLLLENYGLPKPGFTDEELQAAFEKVAGADLSDFFQRYVYGAEEIDFERYWRLAGLQMTGVYQNPTPTFASANRKPGALGLRTRPGGTVVGFVLAGQPAYEGGVNAGDELIALDGRKLDAGNVSERLNEIREGQRVTLTLFRRERLLTFELTAALKPFDTYALTPLKEMSAEQQTIQRTWLNEAAKQ